MELNVDILNEFKAITTKDIQSFFKDTVTFLTGAYNTLVAFYSGRIKEIDKGVFQEFEQLTVRCDEMFAAFHSSKARLGNLKFWELLQQLEEIELRLMTVRKINKWSRSSLTIFGYDQALRAIYTLRPHQTLERVSQDILSKGNPTDDWYNVAVDNQLHEEDYTPMGGVDLNLRFPQINQGVQVLSVVDMMVGKSIYGKDVYKRIQFISDDLTVLDYDSTIVQSVDILANLRKNDNPEYPQDGLQREVVVGGNRAALNFPIINRQLIDTFATDDSLKNFQLLNIDIDQDNLNINFQVQTRLNETKDGQIVV